MVNILLYCTRDCTRTIDDLIDNTDRKLLDKVIICNDSGIDMTVPDGVEIQTTNGIGRPSAWNMAAKLVNGGVDVFIRQNMKFTPEWIYPIIESVGDDNIVAPSVHQLDISLWETVAKKWDHCGIRWDLSVVNRKIASDYSPIVTSYCLAISHNRFVTIGGFDDGIVGHGEDIEICIRNWLFGGSVIKCDGYVSSVIDVDTSVVGLARIVELWFSKYSTFFYSSRRLDPRDIKIGRTNRILDLAQKHQVRAIEWWLENIQPELLSIISLKDTRTCRSVAVVGVGPTLDYIEPSQIEKHDVIIGVDHAGMEFDCDYVMTDSVHVAETLLTKYSADRFVIPYALSDKASGEYIQAGKVVPGSIQFDQLDTGVAPDDVNPPFADYGSVVHSAVHFALFLGPRSVTLFGCDNRLIDGKSHSAKCGYYDDGKILPDSDNTRKRFMLFETGLRQLGEIACKTKIPLLRIGHL